jgi:hypothetical protein
MITARSQAAEPSGGTGGAGAVWWPAAAQAMALRREQMGPGAVAHPAWRQSYRRAAALVPQPVPHLGQSLPPFIPLLSLLRKTWPRRQRPRLALPHRSLRACWCCTWRAAGHRAPPPLSGAAGCAATLPRPSTNPMLCILIRPPPTLCGPALPTQPVAGSRERCGWKRGRRVRWEPHQGSHRRPRAHVRMSSTIAATLLVTFSRIARSVTAGAPWTSVARCAAGRTAQ